ncbi:MULTISPECIES: hypothetical protein [unclassified Pseudomonas]|uniref:hypothetical protein n=1 Tax=unclassified Pseudomonas TaxID=196821 RepID=UPI0015870586|nr:MULTISPECIES: hypothetical protein [unclassified Pseudomonas]
MKIDTRHRYSWFGIKKEPCIRSYTADIHVVSLGNNNFAACWQEKSGSTVANVQLVGA